MANENNDNLPVSKEKVVKKEGGIFDDMKDMAMISFIEGLLPKLEPFIAPATAKLEEYFGDDTKIFSISRRKNQATKVIVLDNTKGNYLISSYVPDYTPEEINGRLETPQEVEARLIKEVTAELDLIKQKRIAEIKNKTNKRVAGFTSAISAVINVHDTGEFIKKLLSGEFTKQ